MELKELLDLGWWFGPALWPALGALATGWGVNLLINRISLWRKGARLYWMEETSPHKPEPVRHIFLAFTGALAAAGLLTWFNPPTGISLGLYVLFLLPEKLNKRKWKSRIEVRRFALWYQDIWHKMEDLQRITLFDNTAVLHLKNGGKLQISGTDLNKLMDSHPIVRFRIDQNRYLTLMHATNCALMEKEALTGMRPLSYDLSLDSFFLGFPDSLRLYRQITRGLERVPGFNTKVTPTFLEICISEGTTMWFSIGDRRRKEKSREPLVLHLPYLPDPRYLTDGPSKRNFLQEDLTDGRLMVHIPIKDKKRSGSRFITPKEAENILHEFFKVRPDL